MAHLVRDEGYFSMATTRMFVFGIAALCSMAASAANLLVNGDFEAGSQGFTSDYDQRPGDLSEGGYAVLRSPADGNALGASFPDHTSGHGFMLAANGGPDSRKAVWRQRVKVSPSQTYCFSGWAASWGKGWNLKTRIAKNADPCPPQMRISINGHDCGPLIRVPAANGNWSHFGVTWDAGASAEAEIEIRLATTAARGNDLALDDLQFRPASEMEMVAERARDWPPRTDEPGKGGTATLFQPGTAPLAAPKWIDGLKISRAVEISWVSVTNRLYQIQWAADLQSTYWADLGAPVIGSGMITSVFDSTESTGKRFYRLLSFE
jgi:hypothetical protein